MVESEKVLKEYSMNELLENNGENGKPLWILLKGNIYDVTNFKHPGGKEVLTDDHGDDRWEEFNSIHSKGAKEQAKDYLVGKLIQSESKSNQKTKSDKDDKKEKQEYNKAIVPIIILLLSYFLLFKFNLLGLFNKPEKTNEN